MESAVLGLVLDSSAVIDAEWKAIGDRLYRSHPGRAWTRRPLTIAVTVAELVHGIYRAKSPEASQRRREYIEELVNLIPVHPVTSRTAWLMGQIDGQETARGNVLPFNDLMIAVSAIEQGYSVLTGNLRHFQKIPGVTVLSIEERGQT